MQVVRNGLRAVAFGSGDGGTLELRYMAANADIQNGDVLVTSGIDGTYPPGLPVASVARVERDAAYAFAQDRLRSPPPASSAAATCWCSSSEARPAAPARPEAGARERKAAQDASARRKKKRRRWRHDRAAAHPAAGAAWALIVASLAGALLLNFLPWQDVALAPGLRRAGARLLVRAPAAHDRPRHAWLLGLLMDAGNGVLLGQHALAYSVLAFAAHRAVAPHPVVPALGPGAARRCCCCWSRSCVALGVRLAGGRRVSRLVARSSGRSSAPRSGRR